MCGGEDAQERLLEEGEGTSECREITSLEEGGGEGAWRSDA